MKQVDHKKIFTDKRILFLTATFCCLLWGSAYPAVKNGYALFNIAAEDVPSKMLFAGYRFILAGVIILIISLLLNRKIFSLSKKEMSQVALLGLSQTSIQYVFFYIGLAYTTGVKGSIMNSTTTFFSVILAHLLYKNDKLNLHKIMGCLLGFAGVMTVSFGTGLRDFNFSFLGEGFVTISAFMLSVGSIYSKKITQSIDTMVVTGYQLAFGGVVLTLVGYLGHGKITGFTVASTALLFYLAVLSSAAFTFWTILLKYNKVGEVSIFNFLIPVFGTLLSAIFLKESIWELKNAIALVFVSFGIWAVNSSGKRNLERDVSIKDIQKEKETRST